MTEIKKSEGGIFKNPIIVAAFAVLCCALWGSATPFIKLGYRYLMPTEPTPGVPSILVFAGIRFFLAGVLTVAIYSIARRRFLYPKASNLWRVGTQSCFQTMLQYIFFYLGLSLTTGVKGTIASGSSTFFAIIIAALIFGQEKLSVKKGIGCILGFLGIIVVNLTSLQGIDFNLGDAFVIISAVANGVSATLAKKFSKHEDPVVLSGYQFVFGGAILAVVGFIAGGKLDFTNVKGIGVLIYLAFLSAIAYSLWSVLLKYNHVSRVTIFSFTTPIFGVILSFIMLPGESEINFLYLFLALALVSLGILTINIQPRAKAAPAEPRENTEASEEKSCDEDEKKYAMLCNESEENR